DIGSAGAESEPDADLLLALSDRLRHHAVHSHDAKEQRDCREDRDHYSLHLLPGERFAQQLVQCPRVRRYKLRINCKYLTADLRADRIGIAVCSHHPTQWKDSVEKRH